MPFMDSPRNDTAKTVREVQTLGLSVKMLTGDAVSIACETSRQLCLGINIYDAERLGLGGGGDMPGFQVLILLRLPMALLKFFLSISTALSKYFSNVATL
jgi:magnesium-transporting ATPase (P-type)